MNVQHCLKSSCLLFFALVLSLSACTDDATDNNTLSNNTTIGCPPGQLPHPITGVCRAPVVNPNNVTPVVDETPDADATVDVTPELDQGPDAQDATGDTRPDISLPDDETADSTRTCGYGNVSGRACAPSGAGVSGATVTISGIDCHTGQAFTQDVVTDNSGAYAFTNLPTGDHEVRISSGSFNQRFRVDLMDGEDQDLTTQQGKYCLAADSTKIAVVGGRYDHVEDILGQLGLDFEMKGDDDAMSAMAIAFLSDLSALNQYDIVFINCGELWGSVSASPNNPARVAMLTAIRDYVLAGGSLYASDLAHPFIEESIPNVINFLGDDIELGQARDGYAPQMITATVTDPGLVAALGTSSIVVDFPQDPSAGVYNNNWVIMEGSLPAARVFMRGSAKRCPSTRGCVGAFDGTISDVPLLSSYTFAAGGSVVFTSFHNERQQSVSQDILNTLRYLIFQL